MNAIKTIELEYIYTDGTPALSGINFEAKKGEKVAVLGENGSGKTTLFYHFNGLMKPTKGKIEIFGEAINKKNIYEIRKKVGLVFQNPDAQLFAPTVYDDIAYGLKNLKIHKDEIKNKVKDILLKFDIESLALKNPDNLSGGQKKRVAIAGVVVMEPDILVLDEPTSGMDAKGINDTIEILDELNSEGKTIIVSTHNSELAASWADRVYVLNKGKVFNCGTPEQIFGNDKIIQNAGLKHPIIVQTFREFHARGISKGETPLSLIDFIDSIQGVKVMNIRCAVAECDVSVGDEVCINMENGMLVAKKGYNKGAIGKVIYGGKKGDDIAVGELSGDIAHFNGNITIIKVPSIIEGGSRAVTLDKVWEILEKTKYQKIGAMGTSAKVLVNKMEINCELEFDVIQSGMLAALRGFNVVIFASGNMGERVIEKVKNKNISYSYYTL